MFFEWRVEKVSAEELGWIISKHPQNAYNKLIKPGRTAIANWVHHDQAVGFTLKVVNDPTLFIEKMKIENRANYVDSALHSVCGYNLFVFKEVFSSCLKDKYDKQSTRHDQPFSMRAVVGPWPGSPQLLHTRLKEVCPPLGLETAPDAKYGSRVVEFRTMAPMTCSTFLKKIYLLGLFLTQKFAHTDFKLQGAEHLVSGWESQLTNNFRKYLGLKVVKVAKQKVENAGNNEEDAGKGLLKQQVEKGMEEVEEGASKDVNEEELKEKLVSLPKIDQFYVPEDHPTLENISLHPLRLKMIMDILEQFKDQNLKVLEIGAGKGDGALQITNLFPNFSYIAMDKNDRILRNFKLKKKKNVEVICGDILFPEKPEKFLGVNIVICSEVIEHYYERDREKLMMVITDFIRPNYIILTTPNVDFNKNFSHLCDGKYRHPHHKIEFNQVEWKKELQSLVEKKGYSLKNYNLFEESQVQPIFISLANLEKEVQKNTRQEAFSRTYLHEAMDFSQALWLPRNQSLISKSKLLAGIQSFYFQQSGGSPFCLGPTIAPVDCAEDAGDPSKPESFYLEHPETAFSFFSSFGISQVTCERKYMGSRAHVFVMRKNRRFEMFYGPTFQVLSRNGLNFFEKYSDISMKLKEELLETIEKINTEDHLEVDFLILDGEMLPWSLKAKDLITEEFSDPGECALISREYIHTKESEETRKAELFLKSLSYYTKTVEPEYRVFQIYAGKIDPNTKIPRITHYGPTMDLKDKYNFIKKLESKMVKPVEYLIVDLNSQEQRKNATKEWEQYCNNGGEGWVVKLPKQFQDTPDGQMITPMLKVRGREYLRLVYGLDYLDPNYFAMIKKREISPKRKLSRLQFELQDSIIKCFLNGHKHELIKYVIAFFGSDSGKINATL
eukprot:TRINITY_DN7008_c0_g1_i1.p1 TRINITY_DN7008_c0_g1~~TRINITY_DN7008_c0_g1_i1.p1  ORF type:complete len:895 (-),score=266.38 TRINITY_DN7008_c0_g1_i1:6-2690(-)